MGPILIEANRAGVVRKAAALIETHDLDTAGGAHGRAVAETLARIAPDPEAIAAALLLPALEDRRLDVTTIERCVGAETARLVAALPGSGDIFGPRRRPCYSHVPSIQWCSSSV